MLSLSRDAVLTWPISARREWYRRKRSSENTTHNLKHRDVKPCRCGGFELRKQTSGMRSSLGLVVKMLRQRDYWHGFKAERRTHRLHLLVACVAVLRWI